MSSPILTAKQAAAYCGMSVQTLYNLNSTGHGPKRFKQGSRLAFYEADLDEWNKSRLIEVP